MPAVPRRATSARSRRISLHAVRPVAEALERRRLLTAAFSFDGGHVYAPAGLYPDSIAVGNMNGDAFPDLVVGNYINGTTSRVDVLLGNGNGTFRLGSSINVPHRAEFIKIGDYNGDGRNDVFLGFNQVESAPPPYNFWTRGYVTLLAGNGNGTLQNPTGQIPLPNGALDGLAVADFNKDGRADFAMTGDSGLYIDYSNGNGTFGNALTDASANIHGLWVADLNGDSRTDVLFSRDPGGGTSYVLGDRLQNADGTWQAAKTTPLLAAPADVAVGDFNEDGKADVAVSENGTAVNNSARVQVKSGDGAGNFSDVTSYNFAGMEPPALAVGDFNFDFHLDLAMSVFNLAGTGVPTSFYLLPGTGKGTFGPAVAGTTATDDTNFIFRGDFNNDGKPDLLVAPHEAQQIATFLNVASFRNSIRGNVWNDLNKDGINNAGEPPLGGWTVWADNNDNNVVDPGEASATTAADGSYELLVTDGTQKVRQLLPPGWIETPRGTPGAKSSYYSVTVSGRQITKGWNFSACFLGTVSGFVYNDYNASKTFDPVESGLAGRTVYADLDNSGTLNGNEPWTTTQSDGSYGLVLPTGKTYTIRDVPVAGWYVTDVASASVVVPTGGAVYGVNFGRTQLGGVSGTVYYDTAQNGYRDGADAGIPNVRVYLDRNDNGSYDAGEPTAVTDSAGNYSIGNQFPGPAVVRIVKPTANYRITDPTSAGTPDGFYNTFVYGGFPGGYTDFGLVNPAFAAGKVFNDANANGTIDAGEAGLPNFYVAVDYNGNGLADVGEPSAITDANGNFTIASSRAGSFKLIVLRPSGYTATVPSSSTRTVNFVQASTVSGQNFGMIQGPFSNAPYQPPINIPTGSNPVALAAGDFNKDGRIDFVVANNASPGQIFLGQGNGLFTHDAAKDFFIGDATRYMISADVNGDGKMDLIAANQDDNAVSVLLGNGDGTFAPAVSYPAGMGTYGVAVGDFNGDGKLDVVAANSADTVFSLFINKGGGAFNAAVQITTEYGGKSIFAGDVNKDGKMDVVIANDADSSITYFPGNGNGTFGPRVRLTNGITQPSFVTLADVNKDGNLDLIYINQYSDQVGVALGNGNGTFKAPAFFATASMPQQLAVIDVDRDGRLDLVVSCRSDGTTDISGGVSILRGRGDGTFVDQLVSTAHTSPTAVAIADFNGDGKLDIVTANFYSSDVSLLLNGTSGPYGSVSGTLWKDANVNGTFDAGEAGLANQVVFADVNNNGILDAGERFTTTTGTGAYLLGNLAAGTYHIRALGTSDFQQSSPANRASLDVTLTAGQVVTGRNIGMAPTAFDGGTVIDNSAAVLTGAWTTATATPGFFGGNYLTDGNAGKGAKSARFNAALPFDGYYQVYVRWTADGTRANNVPIDVVSSTNTRTVTVNQQQNNGVWVSLGIYPFKTTGGSVLIRTDGTSGLVVADAVRFVAVPAPATVTKDNADPTGIAVTGSWTTSAEPGSFGANALNDGNPATKGGKSVAFAAGTLAVPGVYEIFGWWTAAANRASNARFDILTSTGTTTLSVNERLKGSQWVSLGYYTLNASGAKVTIRNDAANGYVCADAIRFVKV